MTQSNNIPPANEPAPMAIPITTQDSNIVASNFWKQKVKRWIKYEKWNR